MQSRNYFKAEGVAQLYKIPLTTVWKMIREGEFPNVLKVGKHYRIPEESLAEFERRHKATAHA